MTDTEVLLKDLTGEWAAKIHVYTMRIARQRNRILEREIKAYLDGGGKMKGLQIWHRHDGAIELRTTRKRLVFRLEPFKPEIKP